MDIYGEDVVEFQCHGGMVVAQNEFTNVNYSYVYWDEANDEYALEYIDRETTSVTVTINKLAINATIMNVTKVYGQATDLYKADDGADGNYRGRC